MAFRDIYIDPQTAYNTMALGVAGENLATRIVVDCRSAISSWQNISVAVLISREDGIAYPAAGNLLPDADGYAYYEITNIDTAIPGFVKMEIQVLSGNRLAKSVTVPFRLRDSVSITSDAVPPAKPAWTDDLLATAESTRHAGVEARAAADYAREVASEAKEDVTAAIGQTTADATAAIEEALATAKTEIEQTSATAEAAIEQASDEAKQATVEAGAIIDSAQAALDDLEAAALRRAASKWQFYADGNPVVIMPAEGSGMRVVADKACTLTYGTKNVQLTANTPVVITATGGGMTLTANNSAFLAVAYNRDSMAVLDDLTAPVTGSGAVAQIDGCVGGLPLTITAKAVAAQAGSGDPSPDNVRAISGKSAINVWRGRKNLCPAHAQQPITVSPSGGVIVTFPDTNSTKLTYQGTGTTSGVAARWLALPAKFSADKTLTLSGSWVANTASATSVRILAYWMTSAYASVGMITGGTVSTSGAKATFTPGTPPDGAVYLAVVLQPKTSSEQFSNGDSVTYTNVQLEFGSAATAYEPYVGQTYTVTLPETAYGLPTVPDEVDLALGLLTKRTKPLTLTGAENWVLQSGTTYEVPNTGQKSAGAIECSHFSARATGSYLRLLNTEHASVAELKVYLVAQNAADTPVQILYELAAPQAVTFDPKIIPSLSGKNVIYTDAEGDTAATGRMGAAGTAARMDAMQQQITQLQQVVTG